MQQTAGIFYTLNFFIQTNSTNTKIAYCVNIAFKKSFVSSGLADLLMSRKLLSCGKGAPELDSGTLAQEWLVRY